MALVGEWGFTEGTGTTAADSAGSHTATNVPGWTTPGHGANLACLATSNQQGARVAPFTSGVTVWTVMGWFYIPSGLSGYSSLLEDTNFAGNGIGYLEWNGQLDWQNYTANSGSFTVTTNAWHHIACVNGASALLVVDGTTLSTFSPSTGTWPSGGIMQVGGGQDQPGTYRVSDLRIFDAALTNAEVNTWMNTALGVGGGPNPAPTIVIPRAASVRASRW